MTKVFITSEITKIHCDEKLSSNSGMFFGPTPATISCPRLSNQSRTTNVNPHAQTKLFLCINLLERERERVVKNQAWRWRVGCQALQGRKSRRGFIRFSSKDKPTAEPMAMKMRHLVTKSHCSMHPRIPRFIYAVLAKLLCRRHTTKGTW